jgi:hypothetical protein
MALEQVLMALKQVLMAQILCPTLPPSPILDSEKNPPLPI